MNPPSPSHRQSGRRFAGVVLGIGLGGFCGRDRTAPDRAVALGKEGLRRSFGVDRQLLQAPPALR